MKQRNVICGKCGRLIASDELSHHSMKCRFKNSGHTSWKPQYSPEKRAFDEASKIIKMNKLFKGIE